MQLERMDLNGQLHYFYKLSSSPIIYKLDLVQVIGFCYIEIHYYKKIRKVAVFFKEERLWKEYILKTEILNLHVFVYFYFT